MHSVIFRSAARSAGPEGWGVGIDEGGELGEEVGDGLRVEAAAVTEADRHLVVTASLGPMTAW